MRSISVSYDDRSDDEVMQFVMHEVFADSHFNSGTESIQPAKGTRWGEPKDWYKSGKFTYQFATIRTKDWLKIHDSINHSTDQAHQSTVDWVQEIINTNEESEIPTPTLALEPTEFGEQPLEYTPVKEGRSRGVGAKEAGLERIPILVSVRRPWL